MKGYARGHGTPDAAAVLNTKALAFDPSAGSKGGAWSGTGGGVKLTGDQQAQMMQLEERDADFDLQLDEIGEGIPVTLDIRDGDEWVQVGEGVTGANGRVEGFGIEAEDADYRLTFDLDAYAVLGDAPFFPEIAIVFDVSDTDRHHHVPVLVSPFGYSTYLGN